ncbi:MAG: HAD family phosphatase [Maritimibacter sp.]
MTPKAVLFDCDGVLVDSERLTNAIVRDDLAAAGLEMTLDEVMNAFVGGTMVGVADEARRMGADLPDDWVPQFYKRLYARLAEGTPLIAGVETVLDRLDAAGIVYGVGSNGSTEKMQTTLGQHPTVWNRVKDQLYSGQELGCAKPDPGLYLHVAKALGVLPEACVVVEDSVNGCRAGVAAGIRTLGYAAHGEGATLAATGAEVFTDMVDLPGLIGL